MRRLVASRLIFYKMETFADSTFEITDAGRDVLRGEADHIELNGIDCWRGGVHLHGHLQGQTIWRWDSAAGRMVNAAL